MAFFDNLSRIPLYRRLIVLVLLLLLIGIGFYFLVYSPKSKEIARLKAESDKLNGELQTLRALSDKLDVLKKLNAQLTEQLILAEAKLPKDKEIPTILATISNLGDRNGLAFETFSPGVLSKKGFYGEIPLSFRIKGPFHQLVTFFDQISRLPRIIGFKDIKMGVPTLKDNMTFITANCQAVTYVFLSQGGE